MRFTRVFVVILCYIALPEVQWARGEDSQATDRSERPLAYTAAAEIDSQASVGGQEQMPPVQPSQDDRIDRRPRQRTRNNEKNDATVKAAFGEAVPQAAGATVRILVDGRAAALGTVVDGNGHVVSKASLLEGTLTCRLNDGRELDADLVGVNENHDLALLKVAGAGLTPVLWRTGDVPPPGSLVAALGPEESIASIGVVSAEPRKIPGSTRPDGTRGWLGVGLGGGQSDLEITTVGTGSAAEKAGLKIGDRVKSIDGEAMLSTEHVVETVGSHASGETINLVIERGEKELQLAATLDRRRVRWSPQDHWGGGPFSRRRRGFPLVLTHDAVVHPSDCGGPLVDTSGNAVGINIARALRVATYALPADVVQEVVKELGGSQTEARDN
jgi:serine protease Do